MALLLIAAFTCSSGGPQEACPTPRPGSNEAGIVARTRSEAGFPLLYPCRLPGAEYLADASVTGTPGRQQAEFVFAGPFDMRIRQSQYPPPVSPDPAGVSRTTISLFPNIQAQFVQKNDGSPRALYHLFWQQGALYYELQAFGPSQQQPLILQVARSLQ